MIINLFQIKLLKCLNILYGFPGCPRRPKFASTHRRECTLTTGIQVPFFITYFPSLLSFLFHSSFPSFFPSCIPSFCLLYVLTPSLSLLLSYSLSPSLTFPLLQSLASSSPSPSLSLTQSLLYSCTLAIFLTLRHNARGLLSRRIQVSLVLINTNIQYSIHYSVREFYPPHNVTIHSPNPRNRHILHS